MNPITLMKHTKWTRLTREANKCPALFLVFHLLSPFVKIQDLTHTE